MTVARIRERKGADHVEVLFLESPRFYKLLKKNPAYDEILKQLREAMTSGHVVKVRRASPDSEIIDAVQS